jgi:serine phosphatase RsbU (regulator of sigma subunit)
VIGDVVGHDVDAAAAMGQVRSTLRGIAHDRDGRRSGRVSPGRRAQDDG